MGPCDVKGDPWTPVKPDALPTAPPLLCVSHQSDIIMSKRGKQSLIDDSDADFGELKVNKSYASRFEHNKQREELHRLQAKHPEMAARIERQSMRDSRVSFCCSPLMQLIADGFDTMNQRHNGADDGEDLEDDESSSEEEDLGEIPDETEAKILDTLIKIKRKDPAIYQSDVRFFEKEEEEDGDEEGEQAPQASKSKPKYLKDMIAQNLLKHGPEIEEDEEEEEARACKKRTRAPKAYDDEQEQLRKAFISSAVDGGEGDAVDGDDFGGVLKPRVKIDQEQDDEEEAEDIPQLDKAKGKKKGSKKKIKELVDDFFGSASKAEDSNDKFLREYILNKGWEDKADEDGYIPRYQDVVEEDVDDEADEEYLDQADKFEASYNFRFEEPGGANIAVHPRIVEGLIRKTDDKRKRKRAEKAERIEEERSKHSEEVKRLKNLKMMEIEDKISKLQKVAGVSIAPKAGSKIMDALLDDDFDPEAWDKQMAAAFDDGYYAQDDAELDALLEDLEDPELAGPASAGLDPELAGILGDDVDDDDDEGGTGSEEAGVGTYKVLKEKIAEINARAQEEEWEEGEGEGDGEDREARIARHRAEIQRLMDDYYKLDFEDSIGGLRTRFKYKQVPAQNFGLSAEDVLRLSDKDLNQVVGMKRLAPYRDDLDGPQRPNYKALELLSSQPQASKKGHQRGERKGKFDSRERGQQQRQPLDIVKPSFKKEGYKKPRVDEAASSAKVDKAKGDASKKLKASAPSSNQGSSKEEAMAARMASYAKLELRPGGQGSKVGEAGKEKKKEVKAKEKKKAEPQVSLLPPGLTKAQKKNFKRSLKRSKNPSNHESKTEL